MSSAPYDGIREHSSPDFVHDDLLPGSAQISHGRGDAARATRLPAMSLAVLSSGSRDDVGITGCVASQPPATSGGSQADIGRKAKVFGMTRLRFNRWRPTAGGRVEWRHGSRVPQALRTPRSRTFQSQPGWCRRVT